MSIAFEYLLRTHVEQRNDAPIVKTIRPQNNKTTFMKMLFFKFMFARLFRRLVPFLELNVCYPVTKVHLSTIPWARLSKAVL